MKRALRVLGVLTLLMLAATWLLGWWGVPLVAAGAAVWDRNRRGVIALATLAAIVAWVVLLVARSVMGTSVLPLGRDIARSLGVPGPLPLILTLLLAALLAATAAWLVALLRGMLQRPRPGIPS
jgi:ABC-type Fe3+-siderophore transport system permease subunit